MEPFHINTSDYIKELLGKLVLDPYRNTNSVGWQQLVKNTLPTYQTVNFCTIYKSEFHRRVVLSQGRTEFDSPYVHFNPNCSLTSSEKVILYCYYYMQMHVCSYFTVLRNYRHFITDYILANKEHFLFIDYGCGPLTAGISMARYFSPQNKRELINMHYLGIDKSKAMLDFANKISKSDSLFDISNTISFIDNQELVYTEIEKYKAKYQNINLVINFSYFLSSFTVDIEYFCDYIKKIMLLFPSSRICIIYQNPPLADLNSKWFSFKSKFPELRTLKDSPSTLRFSFDDLFGSWYKKTPEKEVFADIIYKPI